MFGRKRKVKVEEVEDSADHEYTQPVPYWRGMLIVTWFARIRDRTKLMLMGGDAIMVIRIRKDRRQDHMVFIPRRVQQNTINWGSETYDIEEGAIIRDNGRTVMYVVEGCRKPIYMSAWRDVCSVLVDELNQDLDEEHLKKYGNVSFSSRDAYTKMNNRDAEMLMRAGQSRYTEYSFYLSAVAALAGVVLVAMMMGLIPSGVYGLLEGMQQFLLSKAAEFESLRI